MKTSALEKKVKSFAVVIRFYGKIN